MKIDYYFGQASNKMFGINRVKLELWKGLPDSINKQKIAYNPINRALNYIDFLTYAPYTAIKNRRKEAIAHILSQSEAHLLNFFKFKKSIVLCYDIIPLVLKYGSLHSRLKANFAIKSMKKADHIIAISHFTKQEIHKHLNYPLEKITVAHLGVDEKYKPNLNTEQIKEKYKLNKASKYLIYTGNEEPRMNISTILQAMAKLKEKHPNLHLIKIGNSNFPGMREKLQQQIKSLNLQNQIHFTGYVPEEDLPYLYNASDIAIYLAEYAGFGLPPLESMACGTPTITSNVSCLPEVAGKGAITINPKDSDQLAKEIERLLVNQSFTEELSKKGVEQASKFTWKKFVEKNIEVYKMLNE